jgi:hypothetical protein
MKSKHNVVPSGCVRCGWFFTVEKPQSFSACQRKLLLFPEKNGPVTDIRTFISELLLMWSENKRGFSELVSVYCTACVLSCHIFLPPPPPPRNPHIYWEDFHLLQFVPRETWQIRNHDLKCEQLCHMRYGALWNTELLWNSCMDLSRLQRNACSVGFTHARSTFLVSKLL